MTLALTQSLYEDLSDDCFVLESDRPLELAQGRYLNLRHDLFDNDAIVLNRTPKEVSISSEKGKKEIRVAFEWDNLGIWHWPHAEVNYVCIEPWDLSSFPQKYCGGSGNSAGTSFSGCR